MLCGGVATLIGLTPQPQVLRRAIKGRAWLALLRELKNRKKVMAADKRRWTPIRIVLYLSRKHVRRASLPVAASSTSPAPALDRSSGKCRFAPQRLVSGAGRGDMQGCLSYRRVQRSATLGRTCVFPV